MKFLSPAHWGHAPRDPLLWFSAALSGERPPFILLSISPSHSPATSFWHSAEIKMDVSPAEMGRYGMCKAKMGPDMAHIGQPIRMALLLPGLPELFRNFGVENTWLWRNTAVGICRWRTHKLSREFVHNLESSPQTYVNVGFHALCHILLIQ